MNIGILALAIAAIAAPIALLGAPYNKPPVPEQKAVKYPYPREL